MVSNIHYYFIYDNNEEFKYHLDILCKIFGYEILQNLNNDTVEGIVDIKLGSINEIELFDLLINYKDDELRILKIADELVIGTDRALNEIGL